MAAAGAVRDRGVRRVVAAMNGRTTAEIVADLRAFGTSNAYRRGDIDDAAERLAELATPRLAKACAILAEGPTHPQYQQLVDAIDTALELDPVAP